MVRVWLLLVLCLVFFSAGGYCDEIIYESAELGWVGSWGGLGFDSETYSGCRFYVPHRVKVTQIGGHLYGQGDVFGAIVPLSGSSDMPDGSPLDLEEVIAHTVFSLTNTGSDYRAPLEVILEKGHYSLIFGSGMYGATGDGVTATLMQYYVAGSFIAWQGEGWFKHYPDQGATPRFVVEGINGYTISGNVVDTSGEGIEGVRVSTNNYGGADTTDSNGYYTLTVPYDWSGAVYVADTLWACDSSLRYTNVLADVSSADFTVNKKPVLPVLSGYVRDDNGTGMPGVTVSANYVYGVVRKYITDNDGYFEIIVSYDWSGSISAEKYKLSFSPESLSYTNVTSDLSVPDFTGAYTGIKVTSDGTGDFRWIQNAINAAVDGDVIQIADGTYVAGNWDIDFSGKAITVRGNVADPSKVVIDCHATETRLHRGFKFISGEGPDSVLEGLTIINGDGHVDYSLNYSVGGAIFIDESSPTIRHCVFNNNEAYFGGAVFCGNGAPVFDRCIFRKNTAENGGGIYSHWSHNLSISGCVVDDNSAAKGAGIYNRSSTDMSVAHSTIRHNSVGYGTGGGIYNDKGFVLINNCIIWDNWGFTNSQLYDCTSATYSCIKGWTGSGIGNISDNPSIVVSLNGNYHLRENSPCINVGDPDVLFDTDDKDFDGDPRIVCGRIDMGADEFFIMDSAALFVPKKSFDYISPGIGSNVISQTVEIYNSGEHVLNWRIDNDCDWINIAADSGQTDFSGPSTLTFSIDPNHIQYGMQSCQFLIVDPNALYSPQTILVSLDVLPPIMSVPQAISFGSMGKESVTVTKSLTIENAGYDVLHWSIDGQSEFEWLSVSSASGECSASPSEVLITVDPSLVEYGLHEVQLIISAPDAVASPQTVSISMNVLAPRLALGQTSFSFLSQGETDIPVDQVLSIQNTGYDTMNWKIVGADGCDWLVVAPETGQILRYESEDITLSVDSTMAGYGLHSCQLTVSGPNVVSSPKTVDVSFEVLRPEMEVLPMSLIFECDVDEPNVFAEVLSIASSNNDIINWQIEVTPDCNWISVDATGGQCGDEDGEVVLTVDTAGVDVGNYPVDLVVTGDVSSNDSVTVPIMLRVFYEAGERHVPMEYPNIQAAIDAAVDGDHVVVHPGRYFGQGNNNINLRGKEISLRSLDPNDPEIVAKTIIVPSGWYVFLTHESYYQDAVIDGFTIADGSGGVIIRSEYSMQSPHVRNCVFRDLQAGNIVSGHYSSMLFENCKFTGNTVQRIISCRDYEIGSTFTMKNCLVADNTLVDTSQDNVARCLSFSRMLVKLDNCTIVHNRMMPNETVDFFGFYVINCFESPISITGSIIRGNIPLPGEIFKKQIVYLGSQMPLPSETLVDMSYSNIQYGEDGILIFPDYSSFNDYRGSGQLPAPNLIDPNWIELGEGNIDVDPLFAREPDDGGDGWLDNDDTPNVDESANNIAGDFHLKSQAGRYVWDGFARVDYNYDKQVDLKDFARIAQWWNRNIHNYPSDYYLDVDRNFIINEIELFALCEDYLRPRVFGEWVVDDVTSPCIDAGNPNDTGWGGEPLPNGERVNMGAYGETGEASMSAGEAGNSDGL